MLRTFDITNHICTKPEFSKLGIDKVLYHFDASGKETPTIEIQEGLNASVSQADTKAITKAVSNLIIESISNGTPLNNV